MQHRRDFFKSITGLFIVGFVDPSAMVNKPLPDAAALAVSENLPIKTQFEMLTHFMHAELLKQVPYKSLPPVAETSRMCERFPYQFGIDLGLVPRDITGKTDDQIRDRYVLPAMNRMANEIKSKKASRFAQLPMPYGLDAACRVSGNGISLRGLRAFDFGGEDYPPHWIHRFDVLFTDSAIG